MGRQGSLESNSARRAPGSDLQGRIDRLKNKTRSSFKVSSATSDRFSMTKFNRQRFSRRLDGIELKENLVVARKGVERDQHVQNDDGAQNILHLIFHFPEVDGLPRCVYAGPGTPVSGGLAYIRCNSGLHSARQVDQDRIIKIDHARTQRHRKRRGIEQVGDDAATLERELAIAEGKLPPEQVAMLSRFEGILMMDNSGNHPSAHHQSHAKH
jgi:hypothetical protein